MLLVLDKDTGATVLEPLRKKHDLTCYHNCMVTLFKNK